MHHQAVPVPDRISFGFRAEQIRRLHGDQCQSIGQSVNQSINQSISGVAREASYSLQYRIVGEDSHIGHNVCVHRVCVCVECVCVAFCIQFHLDIRKYCWPSMGIRFLLIAMDYCKWEESSSTATTTRNSDNDNNNHNDSSGGSNNNNSKYICRSSNNNMECIIRNMQDDAVSIFDIWRCIEKHRIFEFGIVWFWKRE